MTREEAKQAATIMDSGLRRQIKLAYERDGLSVEDIAAMLGLEVGLVAIALEATGASKVASQIITNAGGEQTAPHIAIENKLEGYEDAAVAALGRLVDSDNEAISLTAAREVLSIRGGKLRPAKQTSSGPGFTAADMAAAMAAAMEAYSRALQAQAPAVPVISHPTQEETRMLEYPASATAS